MTHRSDTENRFEEGTSAYQRGGFCPVYVGDLFKNRKYRVLNKLGWGEHSTVWLVQDLWKNPGHDQQYLALKVLAAGQDGDDGITQRNVLVRLGSKPSANPRVYNQGRQHVCHLVDHFEHTTPDGSNHFCLVLELMGEDMDTFCLNFTPPAIPIPLMRRFTAQLVLALGWAHSLSITHSEIKPAKILVKLQNPSRIVPSYLAQVPVPPQNSTKDLFMYTPIRSTPLRNWYLDRKTPDALSKFDICLSGWPARNPYQRRRKIILQPHLAPEVLIGAPLNEQTDWWSLGATLITIHAQNRLLFLYTEVTTVKEEQHNYLAQMDKLFGPFPQSFLQKGKPALIEGMFNKDGHVLSAKKWDNPPLRSNWWLPGAEQWEREEFVVFLERLMKIDPKDRPVPIGELIRYPWLTGSAREVLWLSK